MSIAKRAQNVLSGAVELPPQQRRDYVHAACRGDAALLAQVESLLRSQDDARSSLTAPTDGLDHAPTTLTPLREGPGAKIGPYKLLQQIGEGGFGVVFMAEQLHPVTRRVALKIIKLGMDTRQVVARFESERQALAMMDHPNIAKVLDAGATETGRPYFVMELVKGVPITDYCDTANLSTTERLALFIPVCHAVQHAHQKGIIHRDIKPSNVLITLHDGVPVPKVIDFGIAKATQGRLTDKTVFTEYRQMIGTPEYMSPEQAEMSGLDIDTRTDVYSLGVLLYELLTGVTPFDGKQLRSAAYGEIQRILREVEPQKPSTRISTLGATLATTAAHRRVEPRRLSAVIRGDLDWIVMKAMEKDRTRRYETANGFAADVQRHLAGEPVVAAPPSPAYRARKFILKHRAPMAAAGLVAAALLVGLVATGLMLVRAVLAEKKLQDQNALVIEERNRARDAEGAARTEREKAEAERTRAQRLYAEGLISHGDALVTGAEYRSAHAKFGEARAELQRLGESLERLDLSLVRLHYLSPPPLWSVELGEGVSTRWSVLRSRNQLICSRSDRRIYAIDLLTGEQTRSLGASEDVRTLIAADTSAGPVVVVSGLESTSVRDADDWTILRQAPDSRAARGGVISPDGQFVASIDHREKLVFWNLRTMEIFARDQESESFRCLAVSPDGALVAAVLADGAIGVWDFRDGARRATINLPPAAQGGYSSTSRGISCLAFASAPRTILVGESDGKLVSVDFNSNAKVLGRPHDVNIDTVSVAPDGERIITTANDGEIRVLERNGDAWTRSLSLASSAPGSLFGFYIGDTGAKECEAVPGFTPANQGVLVTMSSRGVLSAWPLTAPLRRRGGLGGCLASSADGLLFAGDGPGGPTGRRAEVRDALTGRLLRTMPGQPDNTKASFSPDGSALFMGFGGCAWRVNLLAQRTEWGLQAHDTTHPTNIAISPDGTRLATTNKGEGVARVWDAATGQRLRSLSGHGGEAWAAIFAPRIGAAVAGIPPPNSFDRVIIGPSVAPFISDWDLTTDKPARRAPAYIVRSLALSPDQRTVAVTGGANVIDLIDLDTLRSIAKLGPIPTISYNFAYVSPAGRPGRWGVSNGRTDLRLWDVEQRKEALVLLRNVGDQYIDSLTATPDGSAIIAAGVGRIDFSMPRRTRELQDAGGGDLAARAELYARYGLWEWVRMLLAREKKADREAPAILTARAAWMCGDYASAKAAFADAARRGEVSPTYAQLCASVEDKPIEIALSKVLPLLPDTPAESPAPRPLPPGVLDAADIAATRAKLNEEAVLEGVITNAAWSGTGKAMSIVFASKDGAECGLVAVVFKADRDAFDKVFGGDAAANFSGARVQIRGKLGKYGGYTAKFADTPQIILNDPAQITILK